MNSLYRDYVEISTMIVLQISYKKENYTEVIQNNSSTLFGFCLNKETPTGPFGYFCYDNKTWEIYTTRNYKPSVTTEERITYKMFVIGISNNGVTFSRRFENRIIIQNNCLAQEYQYNNFVLRELRSSFKIVNSTVSNNALKFVISNVNAGIPVRLVKLQLQKSGFEKYRIQIQDTQFNILDNFTANLVNEQLIMNHSIIVNSTVVYLTITSVLQPDVHLLELTSLYYLNLNDFCKSSLVWNAYNVWQTLARTVKQTNIKCIEDPYNMIPTMKSCDSKCLSFYNDHLCIAFLLLFRK